MFTITASGTSGASKTLDDAIVISPAPPPIIILSSTGVSFGDQLVGSSSAAHTVTIDNALFSSQPLVLGSLSVAGANSADFSLGNDTCSGKSLAPNASCTVDVVFTPTQVGSRTASLNIPSNAASSPDSVTLTGNGTAPPAADVRLRITGPTSALNGTQNTYLMNIANAGPAKAVGVTMNVQVPSGTKFVAVSTTQGSCTYPASGATLGTIRCALGDLASGAAALDTVTLKLALTGKGGSIALVGQATSSSTPDPDLSNNVASPTTTLKKK